MLYDVSALRALSIGATDGAIGKVDDVYFDDTSWTVRYLVVDCHPWRPGSKVLISPMAAGAIDWNARTLAVRLTRAQVEAAPDIDTDQPVSRQHEATYSDYYGLPYYWSGPYLWGLASYPNPVLAAEVEAAALREAQVEARDGGDSHLRSAREVSGYTLSATDGALGHVETFLFDSSTWNVRAIVVDTRNWLPGRQVLLPPAWVRHIDWSTGTLHVAVTRDTVRNCPDYHRDATLDADALDLLFRRAREERSAAEGDGA